MTTAAYPVEPTWFLRARAVDVAAEEAVEAQRIAMEERMARYEYPDCAVAP